MCFAGFNVYTVCLPIGCGSHVCNIDALVGVMNNLDYLQVGYKKLEMDVQLHHIFWFGDMNYRYPHTRLLLDSI